MIHPVPAPLTPPAGPRIAKHFAVERSRQLLRLFILPLIVYLLAFFTLTFPLILQFNHAYFTDRLDGYQMIWDVWWVRHALLHLHRLPFFDPMTHFPFGTSLWLHTLNPFNGLLSIPLTLVMSPLHAFNVLVLLAFAGSGVTAFWLCFAATRSYWPSIAGGFAFECTSFRWAHAFGHLHVISTEALPLFLLGTLMLASRPSMIIAIGTALAMFVALLFDQYELFYCSLALLIIVIWSLAGGVPRPRWRRCAFFFCVFCLIGTALCGPIVFFMLRQALHPVLYSHDPEWFSADMLGPFIPDWAWLYHDWTRPIWFAQTSSDIEKSVCIGPAVVIAALFSLWPGKKRPRLRLGNATLLSAIALTFMAFSFGPTLRFRGSPLTTLTPYRALAFIFPPLRLGGCSGRMMIMTQLAVCVLASAGLSRLAALQHKTTRILITCLFLVAMVFEAQPLVLPTCPPDVPRWVSILRDAPGKGAVIDYIGDDLGDGLLYQTVHQRPIAMGDVFRLSMDTYRQTQGVLELAQKGRYQKLAAMGFAYIAQNPNAPLRPLPQYYVDQAARIYSIQPANTVPASR
jgi:hypothetical protein